MPFLGLLRFHPTQNGISRTDLVTSTGFLCVSVGRTLAVAQNDSRWYSMPSQHVCDVTGHSNATLDPDTDILTYEGFCAALTGGPDVATVVVYKVDRLTRSLESMSSTTNSIPVENPDPTGTSVPFDIQVGVQYSANVADTTPTPNPNADFLAWKSPHLAMKSSFLLKSENRLTDCSLRKCPLFSVGVSRSPVFGHKFLWGSRSRSHLVESVANHSNNISILSTPIQN